MRSSHDLSIGAILHGAVVVGVGLHALGDDLVYILASGDKVADDLGRERVLSIEDVIIGIEIIERSSHRFACAR